jgi:hypothetical protein
VVGDDEAEDGIAQELEALVRLRARGLGTPGPVSDGPGKQLVVVEDVSQSFSQGLELLAFAQASALELGEHIVHRVPHCLEVLEVLVFDPEADRTLPQLLLERFDQLDEGQRVGAQVVTERGRFGDLGGFDLEDVGQTVPDELEHLLAVEGTSFDVGLCGHGRHDTGRQLVRL